MAALFDVLKAFTTKQYPTWNELPPELKEGYSQFMINRFLSCKEYLLPLLDDLSCKRLTDEMHYNILINAVRQGYTFFNYNAYKKEPEDDLLLNAIMKEYEVGLREARMYVQDLTEVQKNKLKEKWEDYYKYVINT